MNVIAYRSDRLTLLSLAAALFFAVLPAQQSLAQAAPEDRTPSAAANARSGEQALKQETKDSEAESTDKYRHSATVQWIAKVVHVDDETAAKGFEWINFAVVLLAVGIPLFRILPGVFRKRAEALSLDLETARAATADANSRLNAVEAKLAGLDAEIAAIRRQVEEEMLGDEQRIKASVGEEATRIVAAAEQEITVAGALAQRELKQYAANLAVERALTRLTLNEATDRQLIAEFARTGQGGQN